jgi:hydrophobe/amphiphile efflux-1 (HAE1) family protein
MSIADVSIRRPVFAWMLMSALIIFGAICLLRLGVSQMPDVNFPILDISVTYSGASPEILEAEVAIPIEGRVMSVEGVKEVRSSITQGVANIRMEFEINRDIDAALQEVQAALSQLKLPTEIDPPVIKKQNPEDDPILSIGIASRKSLRETIRYSDLVLQDQFQMIPGVGEVSIAGFSTRNLRVYVDEKKLRANALTVLDVATAIQNGHSELAAGFIEDATTTTNVRAMGEVYTPEAVADIWIRRRGGEVIRDPVVQIKDVATVADGLTDVRRIARISGEPGIALAIRKQRGSNEVEVAKLVKAKIVEVNKSLPEGYKLQVNADFTRATEQIVETTMHKLVFAALITGIICWLFLGTWTSSVNVLMSIPTSILGTFLIMLFAGFTLNLFTLLALTLSISIIVDDAIMMLENIVRHYKLGKGRKRAASEGANEIWQAAVAATVAVIAIFLPVVFMKGIIGKFFFQFGIVISTAVLLSLVEAVTLTPMRCAYFMRRGDDDSRMSRKMARIFDWCSDRYRASLGLALNWRWTVVALSTALFCLSLFLFTRIRKEFVPSQDQNLVFVSLTMPAGTSLAATDDAMKRVEEVVRARPEVDTYVTSVGAGGPNGLINTGSIVVTLKDAKMRTMSHTQFAKMLRDNFKGDKRMRLIARDLSSRGLTSGKAYPISFNIRGPEYTVLREKGIEMMQRLDTSGLAVDLDTDYKEGQPELRIAPDREKAANFGVSVDTISSTIAAAVGGLKQGQFTNDGRRYDIRISLPDASRTSAASIGNLQVRNYLSELVPLEKMVSMTTVPTVQVLSRINRSRALSIFGNIPTGVSQAAALKKAEEIAREILPPGYTFALEGAAQTFDESFSSLYFALSLGVIVAYMVLASQFNSFIHPISILLALPFSISGALMALWGFNQSLNLFSMIGILLLMGIVKKNSILLVEFTNHVRAGHGLDEIPNAPKLKPGEQLSLRMAQLLACPVRLRPIIMTSTATVAAALPLAIDSSPGWESRMPMALAIIGGNIVSTLFTLYVVPCAYNLLAALERPNSATDNDERLLASGNYGVSVSRPTPVGHGSAASDAGPDVHGGDDARVRRRFGKPRS